MDAREGFNQFALRYGLRMTCKRIEARPDGTENRWAKDARHFRLTLYRGSRRMVVYFSQGAAHTVEPGIADLLDCLASDFSSIASARNFEDWAGDLGFDRDSRSAEFIYRAVERQRKAFDRLMWDSGASLPEDLYSLERL